MKKLYAILFTIGISLAFVSKSYALTILNETSKTEIINSGTNQISYEIFTDKGWQSLKMLSVDLEDNNTSVEVLTSENGLSTFQNVLKMSQGTKNVIGAINGDFFNGKTAKGNAIGMTIKDGKYLTSTYYENEVKDTLASFIIEKNDTAFFDYFTNIITLENLKSEDKIPIAEVNKWSSNYEYPVLYTSEWSEYSIGYTEELPLTELVVKNNKVVEVRVKEGPVKIPENGFVVSCLGNVAEVIVNSFPKNSKIKLDIDIDLNLDDVKAAISGGTMLVKDGAIANFTHNISGTNPRTAVGLDKDGKTMYLIVVDGRSQESVGVTQEELALLLIQKGIYEAINLDGGGSTTLVTRKLGSEEITVENKPSDNALRNVPNALAIVNTAKKNGTLANIILEAPTTEIYKGDKISLDVRGYDKYFNPVNISKKKIKWKIDGVDVKIDDKILTAGEMAGTTTITAKIGTKTASISFKIYEKPENYNSGEDMIKEDFMPSGELNIIVAPNIKKPSILLEKLYNSRLIDKLNTAPVVISPNQNSEELQDCISGEIIAAGKYKTFSKENYTVISIDASKNGIRETNIDEWIWLKEDLEKSNQNVLILLNSNMNSWTDIKEKELFINTLCSFGKEKSKNVWIIEPGEITRLSAYKELHILEFAGQEQDENSLIDWIRNSRYMILNSSHEGIKFSLEKIF